MSENDDVFSKNNSSMPTQSDIPANDNISQNTTTNIEAPTQPNMANINTADPNQMYTVKTVIGPDGNPVQTLVPVQQQNSALSANTAINAMNNAQSTIAKPKKKKQSAGYGITTLVLGAIALFCGGLLYVLTASLGTDWIVNLNAYGAILYIIAFIYALAIAPIGSIVFTFASFISGIIGIFKAPKRVVTWVAFIVGQAMGIIGIIAIWTAFPTLFLKG